MKRWLLIIITTVVAFSNVSCSTSVSEEVNAVPTMEEMEIDIDESLELEEIIEEESEKIIESEEIIESGEWDCAKLDFFEPYMEEPTSFVTYDDYYNLICYMLLNHLTTYEFTVENPEYGAEVVQEILEEDVLSAYSDVALFLNTYTDFWSRFVGECEQTLDSSGNVTEYTYIFTLSPKDGTDSDETASELLEAEQVCFELINEMFEEDILTASMSEKEKAYVLYLWICENVEYSYESTYSSSGVTRADNCYDAMVEQCAVCQGITGAYIQLCRVAGVEMYIQIGTTDGNAHSWCKMEVDGTWIYIDPTWGITGGNVEKWFWLTQEEMEEISGYTRSFTIE